MTADPTMPALYRLEAERLRPTRDETSADPWRDLIAALDRLLTDPGPPDPAPVLPPGPPPTPTTTSEETP